MAACDISALNLAKLAYESPRAFAELLRPYVDLAVENLEKLYKVATITCRLNSDTVVVNTPNFGGIGSVEVHCVDALLAHESFPVEALTMALELGADPEKCATKDYRGLIYQASLNRWDIVASVLSCGQFVESTYPKRKTYREFIDDYMQAEQFYRSFCNAFRVYGLRKLDDLLISGEFYAIFNRMRRSALSGFEFKQAYEFRPFHLAVSIVPVPNKLMTELDVRYNELHSVEWPLEKILERFPVRRNEEPPENGRRSNPPGVPKHVATRSARRAVDFRKLEPTLLHHLDLWASRLDESLAELVRKTDVAWEAAALRRWGGRGRFPFDLDGKQGYDLFMVGTDTDGNLVYEKVDTPEPEEKEVASAEA